MPSTPAAARPNLLGCVEFVASHPTPPLGVEMADGTKSGLIDRDDYDSAWRQLERVERMLRESWGIPLGDIDGPTVPVDLPVDGPVKFTPGQLECDPADTPPMDGPTPTTDEDLNNIHIAHCRTLFSGELMINNPDILRALYGELPAADAADQEKPAVGGWANGSRLWAAHHILPIRFVVATRRNGSWQLGPYDILTDAAAERLLATDRCGVAAPGVMAMFPTNPKAGEPEPVEETDTATERELLTFVDGMTVTPADPEQTKAGGPVTWTSATRDGGKWTTAGDAGSYFTDGWVQKAWDAGDIQLTWPTQTTDDDEAAAEQVESPFTSGMVLGVVDWPLPTSVYVYAHYRNHGWRLNEVVDGRLGDLLEDRIVYELIADGRGFVRDDEGNPVDLADTARQYLADNPPASTFNGPLEPGMVVDSTAAHIPWRRAVRERLTWMIDGDQIARATDDTIRLELSRGNARLVEDTACEDGCCDGECDCGDCCDVPAPAEDTTDYVAGMAIAVNNQDACVFWESAVRDDRGRWFVDNRISYATDDQVSELAAAGHITFLDETTIPFKDKAVVIQVTDPGQRPKWSLTRAAAPNAGVWHFDDGSPRVDDLWVRVALATRKVRFLGAPENGTQA